MSHREAAFLQTTAARKAWSASARYAGVSLCYLGGAVLFTLQAVWLYMQLVVIRVRHGWS